MKFTRSDKVKFKHGDEMLTGVVKKYFRDLKRYYVKIDKSCFKLIPEGHCFQSLIAYLSEDELELIGVKIHKSKSDQVAQLKSALQEANKRISQLEEQLKKKNHE